MKLKGIKNIIFDLGDVIINIDSDLVITAFKELFSENYDEMEKELHSKNVLEKFETGEYAADGFISFFQSYNQKLTTKEITDAWNKMLLDIPQERLKLIDKLAKQYRIFLLSNTNEIHLSYIDNYVLENFQIKSMLVNFEKAYYSHELGLRKPNPAIFEHILLDKNLVAEETLFIDDSEEHIIAAKQLNLKTHHLLASETIIDIFNVN
jgi:putative hydrolase of the HAD superfamily